MATNAHLRRMFSVMALRKLFIFISIVFVQTSFAADTTKVLFIGNSITYFNAMPETFEAIANERGNPTKVTVYAPGGTGFVHHVEDPEVYAHFEMDAWDFIVLQPGSNESPGYSFPIEETLDRARVMLDSIQANNSCAQVLFYEISYGVWGASEEDLATYNETMGLIRANLTLMADSTSRYFAPAGESMRAAWNADPSTLLWGSTGDIHPNTLGSYLIACTFYATIFQKPTLGTTYYATLTEEEALKYQEIADTTVLDAMESWRINTYNSHPSANVSISNDTLYYENTSVNMDSVYWDFGDGNFSFESAGSHHYSEELEEVTVKLIAYWGSCVDTLCYFLHLDTSVGEDKLEWGENDLFSVYPNPGNNTLNIRLAKEIPNCFVQFYNQFGALAYSSEGLTIDVSNLPSGIYYLRLVSQDGSIASQQVRWFKE